MNSVIPIGASFDAKTFRGSRISSILPIGTWWQFEHYRNGKLLDFWENKNVTTTEGRNAVLDIMFGAATQITAWYMCLFSNNYIPLVTDTYAVPGYTEVNANIDEATRPAYTIVAASAGVITNTASKASFTANAGITVYGAALVGGGAAANTKGNTAGGGTLFAAAKFAASKSLVDDDILVVTCTVTLADA